MDVGTGAGQEDGPTSDAAVGNRAPVNLPNSQAAMAFHFPTPSFQSHSSLLHSSSLHVPHNREKCALVTTRRVGPLHSYK